MQEHWWVRIPPSLKGWKRFRHRFEAGENPIESNDGRFDRPKRGLTGCVQATYLDKSRVGEFYGSFVTDLFKQLSTAWLSQDRDYFWTGAENVASALETIRPSQRYRSDGMRAGALSKPPIGIFQYSLKGWGHLEVGGKSVKVPPGHAFCARVPSPHFIVSDSKCPEWTFFWFVFDHPYVVDRIFSRQELFNKVIPLPNGSGPLLAATELAEYLWRREGDSFKTEEALFLWMLKMDKWAFSQRHPDEPRQQLLHDIREITLQNLSGEVPIANLAARFNMSRTNFSRYFWRVTGRSPAAYIREIRLNEAANLLRLGGHSVKEIAARTGFTDANHLCKRFRNYFHFSPGAYQKIHRPEPASTIWQKHENEG